MYKIVIKKSVRKDLKRIPKYFISKIKITIEEIAVNPYPSNVKKIQGYENAYRVRVGMYRIVYEVEDKVKIVCIIKVGHRKDVYKDL